MSKIADKTTAKGLIEKIAALKKTETAKAVKKRMAEFKSFSKKSANAWFSELCFCILTANSKALTALKIQKELGSSDAYGFLNYSQKKISAVIRKNRHRFHKIKSGYIVSARSHKDIKHTITKMINSGKSQEEIREFIVKSIKGIGYKEASHFLRNTGFFELAILDRHILSLLKENSYISNIPKPLTKKSYIEIEKIFKTIAKKLKISPAELDLYMWSLKTGKVLK